MGSNRRYGSPSEQAAGRARAALELVPHEPRTRHVWVRANQRPDCMTYAGLVLTWRRECDHTDQPMWVAQVAYVPTGDHLTVAWVPADRLIRAVIDHATSSTGTTPATSWTIRHRPCTTLSAPAPPVDQGDALLPPR